VTDVVRITEVGPRAVVATVIAPDLRIEGTDAEGVVVVARPGAQVEVSHLDDEGEIALRSEGGGGGIVVDEIVAVPAGPQRGALGDVKSALHDVGIIVLAATAAVKLARTMEGVEDASVQYTIRGIRALWFIELEIR